MASVDYTNGAKAVIPADGIGKYFLLKNRLDFSETPLANADSAQVFAIKAGWEIKNVHTKIVTAEGGTASFTIGVTAGASEFEGNGNANAAAGTRTRGIGGTDAGVTAGGVKYTSDGYLYFDASADLDAAVIDVVAEVVDIDADYSE